MLRAPRSGWGGPLTRSISRLGSRKRAATLVLAAAFVLAAGLTLQLSRPTRRLAPASVAPVLPDVPSAEEGRLLEALAAARSGDALPARTLGDFYLEAGRPFSALWAYSFVLRGSAAADTRTALGMSRALSAALFPAEAVDRLRTVVERAPATELRATALRLVELHLRMGQPEAALGVLEKAAGPFRSSAEGALLEARVREALGDAAAAQRDYRRATAVDGSNPESWHRLGLLLLSQGQRKEALAALEHAHSLDLLDPRYLTDLGRATAEGGTTTDRQAAMKLFRQAVAQRPYAPAYYYSGRVLLAKKRLELAEEGFSRATSADRNFAPAYRELADALEKQGRMAEAHHQRALYYSVKDLRAASAREYVAMALADPSRPDGFLMASQAHYKMTQKGEATEMARRAWKRHPGNPRVREQLTALLLLGQNRRAAGALCREWLREDPGALLPLWMLGRLAVTERRLDEGLRYYDQALARGPDDVPLIASLGAVLLDAGSQNLPRAIETLSRAAALDPNHSEVRYQLGVALMRQERLAEAQRLVLRSLDLDPNREEAYGVLVQLARRLRQPGAVALFGPLVRDAEDRLREELMLWRRTWDQPDDAAGFLALAQFLMRTVEPEKAEGQLEQALRLRPGWQPAQQMLGRVRRLIATGPDDPGGRSF